MATFTLRVLTGLVAATLMVLLLSYGCQIAHGESRQFFDSSSEFSIPDLNGTICFAQNGSYASAVLENNIWTFNDLRFNISQRVGNLKVSAENSNVTIYSYRIYRLIGQSAQVRFNVEGVGKQTVDLGLNFSQPTDPIEWNVGAPGNGFLAEGEGWNLLPDNSVVVWGCMGNISVTHYGYFIPDNSNLPFYEQHSILIITSVVLFAAVAVAAAIQLRGRR